MATDNRALAANLSGCRARLLGNLVMAYVCLLAGACAQMQQPATGAAEPSIYHLPPVSGADPDAASIPGLALPAPPLPAPEELPSTALYTVVVAGVPAKELLFSLGRDANLNVDVDDNVDGLVTMNAVDQTLEQILERIGDQVAVRYQRMNGNLIVRADAPHWRTYAVNYVNMTRSSETEVSVSTQIATTGAGVGEDSGGDDEAEGNKSRTVVKNSSFNTFWESVGQALTQIVGGDADRSPVIVNPMAGIISVYGTAGDHREAQRYLDLVLASSKRQVLVEMTIVEIELADRFQAGVDWQRLSSNLGAGSNGPSIVSSLIGGNLNTPPFFAIDYTNSDSAITATLAALESFGEVRVLSSPKLMALNNQTALLKVVDEEVYFTVRQEIVEATQNSPQRAVFTSDIHTVPVGLVMSVTPQISEMGVVMLNVRPTVTRITGFAIDPAPRLAGAGFDNLIPEIQIRELESLLEVSDGQMVVLGGLMQNRFAKDTSGVPLLARIPRISALFSYRDREMVKTELALFIRTTIVRSSGEDGTASAYSALLGAAAPQGSRP